MTTEEIAWHAKQIQPNGWSKAILVAAISFGVFCVPLALIFDHFPAMKAFELPTMVPLVAGWIWFCFLYARSYPRDQFRQHILRELADGRITLTKYHAVAAIKVEEFEDEGSNYFILLADDTVVYITGQYLYDAEEDGEFPCTEFVVGRTAVLCSARDFSTGGIPIPIACTLPPYPENALGTPQVPFDGDLIPIPWRDLLAGQKLLPDPAS